MDCEDVMDAMERASRRIAGMIEDLMALARVSDTDRATPLEAVDLSCLVHDTCDFLAPTATNGGVGLRTDVADGLVVVGLRPVDDLAGGAGGQGAVVEAHVVIGPVERARVAPVLVVAVAVGQVLQQRAAQPDEGDLDVVDADLGREHLDTEGARPDDGGGPAAERR